MQVVTETTGRTRMGGPSGPLEAIIEAPRTLDTRIDLVICHPHPLHGGTMDNKVVHTLARAGRDVGLRAVRFNFRGVGNSAGRHDAGQGEVDDLLAVLASLGRDSPGRAVVLAGFSFGAWIAAQAAARLAGGQSTPCALLLVAPPVQYAGFDALPALGLPRLVVIGRDDEIVNPAAVADWCRRCQPGARLETLPAGHFFHGCLPALKVLVGHWLAAALSPPGGAQ